MATFPACNLLYRSALLPTDSSLEWEASYPNPITTTPPGTLAALKTQVGSGRTPGFPLKACHATDVGGGLAETAGLPGRQLHLALRMHLTMQAMISPCLISSESLDTLLDQWQPGLA